MHQIKQVARPISARRLQVQWRERGFLLECFLVLDGDKRRSSYPLASILANANTAARANFWSRAYGGLWIACAG